MILSEKQAHCRCCDTRFSTDRLFDRHRVGSYAKPGEWRGERRCLTACEMQAKGWHANARGIWVGKAPDMERFAVTAAA
jgi:hypothetical protein